MSGWVLAAAIVVAVAAAVRSTWSPCGLSMLSTITPFTERARGHRFGVTASWFVAGAVVGGATLGAVGAGLAWLVGATGLSPGGTLVVAAGLALAAGAVDAGAFGVRPPFFKRQVNDDWLRQYRPWVYGAGFGWQIGVGLATYIMTAGVVLTLALAALTTAPAAAFVIGAGFGLLRGLAVFAGTRATDPTALRALHARFDRLEAPVRIAVAVVQLVVAVVLGFVVAPVAGLTALVLAGAVAGLARPRRSAVVGLAAEG